MFHHPVLWSVLGVVLAYVTMGCAAEPAVVFPGRHWEQKIPAQVGLDAAKLEAFARFIQQPMGRQGEKPDTFRGVVIKDGYLVYAWGEQDAGGGWFSASKPVLSTLLFFAIQQGKLKGVDDLVGDWRWALSDKDRTMTFRHLADMTSGYACDEAPGAAWAYNDFGIMLYALTLERVYGCSIKDAADAVFAPLQLEDGSLIGDHLKGRGVSTTPRDFARVGWFWLNRGNWNGRQVLAREFFDTYMKPDVPPGLPRTQTAEANDYLDIGSYGGGHNQTDFGPGKYGFNWWFNAPVSKDGPLTFPDAPADIVMASGYGGNLMVILPSQRMVVAARGSWGGVGGARRGGANRLNETLKLLMEAVQAGPGATTQPGAGTTQPAATSPPATRSASQ